MTTAASLSLLKGGSTKTAVAAELEENKEVSEEAVTAEEEVEIDVDELSAKELDQLVKDHEIAVPDGWSKMKAAQKRQWLKDQFEEADGEEAADPDPAEAPVNEEEPSEDEPEKQPEPEPAAKAKPKSKPKSKAKAKAPAGDGEPDLIAETVHEIENIKEETAREAVLTLNDETEMAMFRIGGLLSVIQANQWFSPFSSFKEYIENEARLHYRKALHWVAIYNALAESKVPWSKVQHLGWTKLKELAPILTLDNVDEWAKIAAESTVLNLIELVRAAQNKDKAAPSASPVTTKTFKLHTDQKETVEAALEKARTSANTTADAVALEFICLDYLGSATLEERLKKAGIDKALEALSKAYPDTDFSVDLPEDNG